MQFSQGRKITTNFEVNFSAPRMVCPASVFGNLHKFSHEKKSACVKSTFELS